MRSQLKQCLLIVIYESVLFDYYSKNICFCSNKYHSDNWDLFIEKCLYFSNKISPVFLILQIVTRSFGWFQTWHGHLQCWWVLDCILCITSFSLLGTDILKGDPLGLLDITDEVYITISCYGNDALCVPRVWGIEMSWCLRKWGRTGEYPLWCWHLEDIKYVNGVETLCSLKS